MKTKPSSISTNRIIAVAFILTIFLVGSLVLFADIVSNATLQKASKFVESQYQKQHHLMNMYMAGSNRTVALETMLLEEDPFAKDEALMGFYRNEKEYAYHRDQLSALINDSEYEKNWLRTLNQMARNIGPIQDQIATLAINEEERTATELLFSQTLDELKRFNQKVNDFSLYQAKEIQKSIDLASSQVNALMEKVILLAAVLIIVSMLFSILLARRFSQVNHALRLTNDNLENTVKNRTQALLNTQEKLLTRNQQLEQLSISDPLTQLFNRLKIEQILEKHHERLSRDRKSYCVLLIDLDHFKAINDTFGHHTGDKILKIFSELLQSYFQKEHAIGRWGGEEFIVVMPEGDIHDAEQLAEGFRQLVAQHTFPRVEQITLSSGLACARSDESISELLHRADMALYDAKHAGRNCCTSSNG
ncbi:GGDEF domain-containing protein [Thiomicrorhabdus sp. zzn3]|uniref:GGDEF domain-containing protein n=1 Tax=Thiomicrorhabdus sp. zzn3 TaxID=3039775 RepID=UPI0024368A8D|nr:GGDEF domain-containing protein [Thiomicrorhabdus sp. zzn3]MDG6778621.1 GGDEF domain-containing protein [Thiomicrorhabdus sp. zzn3]